MTLNIIGHKNVSLLKAHLPQHCSLDIIHVQINKQCGTRQVTYISLTLIKFIGSFKLH